MTHGERALRILGGIVGMAAFVAIMLAIVTHFAGAWGVPGFRYTSDNGSPCRNTWSGYVCGPLTRADFELYTQFTLPAGTRILSATVDATHDYSIDAVLLTDKAHQSAAGKALKAKYGACGSGPIPDELSDARQVCWMSTDDDATPVDKPPPPVMYTVTSGLRKDDSRVTVVHIQSR